MRKSVFCAVVGLCGSVLATTVNVAEVPFKTYPFSDPDPIPATEERRYPYFRYDGSTDSAVDRTWKVVTLENDEIRVQVLPEVGGKIWGATDKRTGRDFLYANHVMKFRDIAMRGPWLSGGIEFNFGIIGHAPSSATPVDWYVRENPDGSASCFVSSWEYITRAWWQVEIRLGAAAKSFETRVLWYNASGLAQPYYHWMNAAYPTMKDAELKFPGRQAVGHEGEIETRCWPSDGKGHTIDTYRGNAFGGAKSYHILSGNNGFYGVWWPEIGFGSFHRAEMYEKFGRKIFFWALSREGGIWEDLLTDSDGQYGELQSGRFFVQPRYGNYKTPFKHPTFSPGAAERFAETWGPVRDKSEFDAEYAAPVPTDRPYETPAGFDWNSTYGHYVRGQQYLRERYDRLGAEELRKALELDRFHVPSLSLLAAYEVRRGDYAAAHALARRAMAVDISDAAANYADGFAAFAEGDGVTARERLGLASVSLEYRSAALALVARSYLREGRLGEADAAAKKALSANADNLDARLVRVIANRAKPEGRELAEELLADAPLFHAARYELNRGKGGDAFEGLVVNELPHETYLELGAWYAESGLNEDAAALFRCAGENPVAKIRLGDLEAAKRLPVASVFPFRREELPALKAAAEKDGHWKFKYLYAVLLGYLDGAEEAKALLKSCGTEPDEAVFYVYRARQSAGAARLADLQRAAELGDSWRIGRDLIAYYEEKGDVARMLETTTRYIARFPGCNPLEIAHGRALLKAKKYKACMDFLDGIHLLPSEHRDSGTEIWQAAQEALGLPRTWPEKLGRGEPYPDSPTLKKKDSPACVEVVPVPNEPASLLPAGRTFKLVWNDEFNGTALDESKWSYRTNYWGERAHWFAAPDENSVELKDGFLRMKLITKADGSFASPQLQTGEMMWDDVVGDKDGKVDWKRIPARRKAKFEHRYGYYECRARLQRHDGWWSAFWMQTETPETSWDPGRGGVEHDIMESFKAGKLHPHFMHFGARGKGYRYIAVPSGWKTVDEGMTDIDANAFHRFGFLWEPDGYTLYVDGKVRGPKLTGMVSHVPEFVLLTTEVQWYRRGKGAVPEVKAAAAAGDDFVVDYVRVFDYEPSER